MPFLNGNSNIELEKSDKLSKEEVNEINSKTPKELAESLKKYMDEKDYLDILYSILNKKVKMAQYLLLKHFENEGIQNQKYSFGTLFIKETIRGKIIDKIKLQEWLMRRGLDEYIDTIVSEANVNKLTKSSVESGEPLPDGIEINSWKSINLRRS